MNDAFIFLHQGLDERLGGAGVFASCLFASLRPPPHPLGVHALTHHVQVLATPLLRLTVFLVSLLLRANSIRRARALICQACVTRMTENECQASVCRIIHASM